MHHNQFPAFAGNQSPDPLIDFPKAETNAEISWESVTRPLDRLHAERALVKDLLGISHQTP